MTEKSSATRTGENFSLHIVRKALLREADEGFQRNFLASPLSISFFLNLFASGTKGPILDRFLKVLDAKSLDELHNRTRKLRDLATTDGNENYCRSKPTISTANGVWIDQACTIKDSFRKILESVYEIDAKPLDFKNKSQESAHEISSWVSEKTRGLIKDITEAEEISLASIFVSNTLYFKAEWSNPFRRRNTKEDIFNLLNGSKIDVKFMMEWGEYFPYCSSFDGFKILKIPYASGYGGELFYMYFFLPDETYGLRKLIDGVSSAPEFLNQDFNFHYKEIRKLMIPKFKFENNFDVSELMEALGFPLPDLAETEMIDNIPDYGSNPIKVAQKAFIAVDEYGTEAAAVTYAPAAGCSLNYVPPPPAEIDFIADHPFLFMIKEDKSKVPFFIGAVINPGDMEKREEEEEEEDQDYLWWGIRK